MRDNPKSLICWHCGIHLKDIVLPVEHSARCPQCRADLHVCRMCRHYDIRYTSECAHQAADKVIEKRRVNHCTFFRARHHTYDAGEDRATKDNRQALESLFGGGAGSGDEPRPGSRVDFSQAKKDEAQRALDDLFSGDGDR